MECLHSKAINFLGAELIIISIETVVWLKTQINQNQMSVDNCNI